jgi:hypothetical protein
MSYIKKEDPLASIVAINAKDINRKELANLLKPFVAIDQETKELSFLSEFSGINTNTDKVEIILMAAKARSLLFSASESLSPKDIISLGVIPEGSVKSSLKDLYDHQKIKKDKNGGYFIPYYRVQDIIKKFNK